MARRSDHSRDEIKAMAIAAAAAILARRGVQALSARQVAKDIGYTVGTLYLVFKNLDELILHVNAATLDELAQLLREELHRHVEPQPALRALAHRYWEFAQQQHARWSLLFTHQLAANAKPPAWFATKVRQLFAMVEEPLQQLHATQSSHERALVVRALWGGVHGVCALALSDKLRWGEEVATPELLDSLVTNFLHGLLQG